MLYKFIYQLGIYFRNPSIPQIIQFLKHSSQWDLKTQEAYQLEKIKELVAFSYENSSFYKNRLEGVGINEIKNIEDFYKIPILTKEELLQNIAAIHTQKSFKNAKKASTSGSSGNSLQFVRDEWADSFNRATIFYNYEKHGVKPWECNGYFWGFNFGFQQKVKTRFLDFLQNRFRIFSYDAVSFKKFVKKLKKATYIHGYSSMIYQTAKLINEQQLKKPKGLKMVKGTSEKIYDAYQVEVEKAFGLKMISEYGATESGIIAFECVAGKMHINTEGVFVEEINHEIIVTNLQMKSFPMIRYQLGDYILLDKETTNCSCGSKHPILKEVTGRIGENVYGIDHVYPSLYFYYIFKNICKKHQLSLNYQVIQLKKGELLFKIEQNLNEVQLEILKSEIRKYFASDILYKIETEAEILAEGSKVKSFISKITK